MFEICHVKPWNHPFCQGICERNRTHPSWTCEPPYCYIPLLIWLPGSSGFSFLWKTHEHLPSGRVVWFINDVLSYKWIRLHCFTPTEFWTLWNQSLILEHSCRGPDVIVIQHRHKVWVPHPNTVANVKHVSLGCAISASCTFFFYISCHKVTTSLVASPLSRAYFFFHAMHVPKILVVISPKTSHELKKTLWLFTLSCRNSDFRNRKTKNSTTFQLLHNLSTVVLGSIWVHHYQISKTGSEKTLAIKKPFELDILKPNKW